MFSINELDFYSRNLTQLQTLYGTHNHSIICGELSDAGNSFYDIGAYDTSLNFFQQCLEACTQVYGKVDDHTGRAYINVAKLSIEFASYDVAEQHLQSALSIFQRIYESGADVENIAETYNVFGTLYREKCNYTKSQMYHQKALNMLGRIDRNNNNEHVRERAGTYKHLGDTSYAQCDYVLAVQCYEEADEILKIVELQTLGMVPESYAVEKARLMFNWAKAQSCLTNYSQARTLCMAAERTLVHFHGNDDTIYSAEVEACRGFIYMQEGSYSSAVDHFKHAVSIARDYYGTMNCAPVAAHTASFTKALEKINLFGHSINYYEQSLETFDEIFQTRYHPKIGRIYTDMGSYYRDVGNYSKALVNHKKALAVFQEAYGCKGAHSDFSATYLALGQAYCELEDFDNSHHFNFNSLEIVEDSSVNCEHSPRLIRIYGNIASTFYGEGQYTKAIHYVDAAIDCIQKNGLEEGEDYSSMLYLKGKLICAYGDPETAIEIHKDGISAAIKRAHGSFSAQSAIGHVNIADAYLMQGDYDSCLEHCDAAARHCEEFDKKQGILSKEKVHILICLSCCKYRMTAYKGAKLVLVQARKCLQQIYEGDARCHPLMGIYLECSGDIYRAGGWHSRGLTSYQDALDVLEHAFRENMTRADIARVNGKLGDVYKTFCLDKQALKSQLNSAMTWRKVYKGMESMELAKSLHRVGAAYSSLQEHNKALLYHQRAHGMVVRVQNNGQLTQDVVQSYTWLGNYYNSKQDYSNGLQAHQNAIDVCRQLPSFSRSDMANCLSELGKTYMLKHEYYQARTALNKALKNAIQFYQHEIARVEEEDEGFTPTQDKLSALKCKHFPQAISISIQIGDAWFADAQSVHHNDVNEHKRLRRYEQALKMYKDASKLLKQICVDDNHELCAASLLAAGSIYCQPQLLNMERAYELLKRSFDARIKVYAQGNENHPQIVKGMIEFGKVQAVRGKHVEAYALLEQALEKASKHYGPGKSLLEADAHEGQGQLATVQGEHNEALDHYNKCLNIRAKEFGELAKFNLPLARVYLSLADVCSALGKRQQEDEYRQKYRKVTERSSSKEQTSRTAAPSGCLVM